MPHGVQCWRVRDACCLSLANQLVIWVVVEVSTGTVMCCYNSMCTGMYRVGMNVPLKTNRTNKYAHVPLCHEHACRTVCSVCAYGARVVHHFLSKLSFFEGTHRHRNVLLQLDVHWNVPGWYECSTENKPCKQVCARTCVP